MSNIYSNLPSVDRSSTCICSIDIINRPRKYQEMSLDCNDDKWQMTNLSCTHSKWQFGHRSTIELRDQLGKLIIEWTGITSAWRSQFLRFCSSVLWKVIIYKSSVVWWLLLTCLLLLGRDEMKMILGWWHVCPPLNQWLMEMHKIRAIFPIRFISFSFECWLSILVMKMITLFQTNLTPMTMILERVLLIFFFDWMMTSTPLQMMTMIDKGDGTIRHVIDGYDKVS